MKKIMLALAGAAAVVGMVLGGSIPAQAATGANTVSKGCTLGQQVVAAVTVHSGQTVEMRIGVTQGPIVSAGQSRTWYTGFRSGIVSFAANSSTVYSYSVYCQ